MQSSQLPPPSNPAGPKRQGPPPRTVGSRPGARPGPPKPKNPSPFGGKPMVPISSLIQAPAFTDPEEASTKEEKLNNGDSTVENTEPETKLNEKLEDGVKEVKHSDDGPMNLEIVKSHEEEGLGHGKQDIDLNGKIENKSERHNFENIQHTANHETREIDQDNIKAYKNENYGIAENIQGTQTDEQEKNKTGKDLDAEEKRFKLEQLSPDRAPKEQPQTIDEFEDNHLELLPPGKSEKKNSPSKNGPFSRAKQGPFGNIRHNEIREEDQDDTRDGDQNPSPVVQTGDVYGNQKRISSQEEPRDTEIYEKPSMPVFFKPKTQTSSGEVIESANDFVTKYTSKDSEQRTEEDVSLTLKVKALEIELEKEKREKLALRLEQERLLDENASLKEQLAEATSKIVASASQERDTKDHDLSRKDEEIKRLKSELKSTMEGSRLVTEHSNRVISESTKFKLEAEALILSLEQEKDQLYQKFIAYKKQVQEEYAAKIIALQEREKYLAEKVDEYEKDINKHQGDLKHRTQTINKLATINNEVESALSQWPAFQNVLSQIETHTKLIEESRFQIPSPVKPKNSPIKIQAHKHKEPLQNHEQQEHAHLDQIHQNSKEDNVIPEPQNQYEQNSPFTDVAQEEDQGLVVQPRKSINGDKASNTPETHVEDTSQTLYDQDKNDEIHNKLDMDPFQCSEPVEPLENGWGIEDQHINENEMQEAQEEYAEQPREEYIEQPKEEEFENQQREAEYAEQPREEVFVVHQEESAEQPREEYIEQPREVEFGYQPGEEQLVEQLREEMSAEPVEEKQELPEYREDQLDYKEGNVQPMEVNYNEPPVSEHVENKDFEDLPPVKNEFYGEQASTNAFTAVPAYRMPQKKKKAQPVKKPVIGFKPAQASYSMPDQPQDLGREEQTHHDYGKTEAHAQHPSYEEGERQQDTIELDPETRPPIENSQEVETKPLQFVPFGRNPLTQAKKSAPVKTQPKQAIHRHNAFGQTKMPPENDIYTNENNEAYNQESNEINIMENPSAHEQIYNGEPRVASMQSVESAGETGYGEINGHSQNPVQGKKIKSKKVMKKKQPATGSIFS